MPRLVRLAVVRDRPGEELVLEGKPPLGARRRPRWVTRVLFSAGRGREPATRRLVALECLRARAELVLRDANGAWGAIRESRFPATEIASLRLRAAERVGGALVVELTLLRTGEGEPMLRAIFRVAALDRDDELIELALAMARCLGLRGYRIRSTSPADVELSPSAAAAGVDPYRSAPGMMPVPAAGQPIDFRAAGALRFEEPAPAPDRFDRDRLRDHHMVQWDLWTWNPGEQVVLCQAGRSPANAALMAALVWCPLALLALPLIAGLLWGAIVIGGVILVSLGLLGYVVIECNRIGDVPDGTAAAEFASDAYIAFLYIGLVGAIPPAIWLGGWVLERYRDSLQRQRVFDWSAHELRDLRGNALQETVPFEDILAVVTKSGLSSADVVVQRIGGPDLVVARFRIPYDSASNAASMATDLARALKVPVHLRGAARAIARP